MGTTIKYNHFFGLWFDASKNPIVSHWSLAASRLPWWIFAVLLIPLVQCARRRTFRNMYAVYVAWVVLSSASVWLDSGGSVDPLLIIQPQVQLGLVLTFLPSSPKIVVPVACAGFVAGPPLFQIVSLVYLCKKLGKCLRRTKMCKSRK